MGNKENASWQCLTCGKYMRYSRKKKQSSEGRNCWENAMRREIGWGQISQGFKCSSKHASDKIILLIIRAPETSSEPRSR